MNEAKRSELDAPDGSVISSASKEELHRLVWWLIEQMPWRDKTEEAAEQIRRWREDALIEEMKTLCNQMDQVTGQPWMDLNAKWERAERKLAVVRKPNTV